MDVGVTTLRQQAGFINSEGRGFLGERTNELRCDQSCFRLTNCRRECQSAKSPTRGSSQAAKGKERRRTEGANEVNEIEENVVHDSQTSEADKTDECSGENERQRTAPATKAEETGQGIQRKGRRKKHKRRRNKSEEKEARTSGDADSHNPPPAERCLAVVPWEMFHQPLARGGEADVSLERTGGGEDSGGRWSGTTGASEGGRVKPTQQYGYDDSDDDGEPAAVRQEGGGAHWSTGRPKKVPGVLTDYEMVRFRPRPDSDDDIDDDGESPKTAMTPCAYCERKSRRHKRCSRCHVAEYCDKICQLKHLPVHKADCKHISKWKKARARIPLNVSLAMMLSRICLSVRLPSSFDRIQAFISGLSLPVLLVEVVRQDTRFSKPVAVVRDSSGQETQVLFNVTDMIHPLISASLRPGNFLLIIQSEWHLFARGSEGLRIDGLDSFNVIHMD